ncbi:hypothetical protein TNCV_5071771 [Trichonephila clavipes]|nr:hypothetical protein TNCV_5071771 [Trichonephila clavipes]
MFHILADGLEVADLLLWPPYSPNLNPFYLFFWGYLKLFMYETALATVEHLMPWITVTSVDIASTTDFFGMRSTILRASVSIVQ